MKHYSALQERPFLSTSNGREIEQAQAGCVMHFASVFGRPKQEIWAAVKELMSYVTDDVRRTRRFDDEGGVNIDVPEGSTVFLSFTPGELRSLAGLAVFSRVVYNMRAEKHQLGNRSWLRPISFVHAELNEGRMVVWTHNGKK